MKVQFILMLQLELKHMNSQNLKDLVTEGYTVVKNVLSEQEVLNAREYFWDWLEDLGSGIDRHNIETWSDENWPGNIYTGFIGNHGISQSKFVWYLRAHPKVKDAFAKIWTAHNISLPKESPMIASMDSVICWRPWWFCDFEDWEPKVEGLHCDQNPIDKEGFWCVQGMVPLYDVTETSGGLQVVPKSHSLKVQEMLRPWSIPPHNIGDYILLPSSKTEPSQDLKLSHTLSKEARLVKAEAGDLILWDSRLIHGGLVGKGKPIVGSEPNKSYDLLRLAVPICLMPRKGTPESVLSDRKEAFAKKYTMNHWATETNYVQCGDSHAINITTEPPIHTLSREERELL